MKSGLEPRLELLVLEGGPIFCKKEKEEGEGGPVKKILLQRHSENQESVDSHFFSWYTKYKSR